MLKNATPSVWVSHSSIGDFLKCPRLYFLRNVYKDPLSRNKINVIDPPLALGQVVHDVIDEISKLPAEERLAASPLKRYKTLWRGVEGEKGGFKNKDQEGEFYERGFKMIQRIVDSPGPLANKAVKINSPDNLPPRYTISEEDEIILCGKIDWLEYLEDTDSVHIIDFKTGKWEEDKASLQLPIYYLLASNLQKRDIERVSYWYLESSDKPTEVDLPNAKESEERVLAVAKRIKLARQLEHFVCPQGGCKYCLPYESVISGKGKIVGKSEYQDIYIV
jgi:ATP-dependent helicase/DNAse subunit B